MSAWLLWIGTLFAVAWSALLAIAEEAPGVARGTGERSGPPDDAVPLRGAMQASRLTLLFLAGLGAAAIGAWWRRAPLSAFTVAAVTLALFTLVGDMLPRAIGALGPRVAAGLLPAARASLLPFRPLLGLVSAVDRGLQVLLPPAERANRRVGREEQDILAGVLSLGTATVEEVMTPRLDIRAIDAEADWAEVVEFVRKSDHARIPVYRDDLDHIVGILYAKDLTPAVAGIAEAPDAWHGLVRPAPFVPESKSLAAQLRDFQRGPAHLALVVDEFGGTSGLVTLEDVLEEVVGEIHGEYDVDEEPEIEREGPDRLWVAGTVTVDALAEQLGMPIEEPDVSTVGGLVYAELGRVPHPGEEFRMGDYRVVVERVVRRRIHRVYFERVPPDAAPETAHEVRS